MFIYCKSTSARSVPSFLIQIKCILPVANCTNKLAVQTAAKSCVSRPVPRTEWNDCLCFEIGNAEKQDGITQTDYAFYTPPPALSSHFVLLLHRRVFDHYVFPFVRTLLAGYDNICRAEQETSPTPTSHWLHFGRDDWEVRMHLQFYPRIESYLPFALCTYFWKCSFLSRYSALF